MALRAFILRPLLVAGRRALLALDAYSVANMQSTSHSAQQVGFKSLDGSDIHDEENRSTMQRLLPSYWVWPAQAELDHSGRHLVLKVRPRSD